MASGRKVLASRQPKSSKFLEPVGSSITGLDSLSTLYVCTFLGCTGFPLHSKTLEAAGAQPISSNQDAIDAQDIVPRPHESCQRDKDVQQCGKNQVAAPHRLRRAGVREWYARAARLPAEARLPPTEPALAGRGDARAAPGRKRPDGEVRARSGHRGPPADVRVCRVRRRQARRHRLLEMLAYVLAEGFAQLEETAEAVDTTPLHSTDREALAALRAQAKEARHAIEALSHQLARNETEAIQNGSEVLGQEVTESEKRESEQVRREKLKSVIDDLAKMNSIATELAEELDAIEPKSSRPSGERKKSSNQLGKRQQRLERAMSELEQQVDGVDQTLPGLGESLKPSLEAAKKAMKSASDELGEVRPGDAAGHQRRAMEELGAMKKAIDKRVQDASGRRGGGTGIHRRDERVEIPASDEHGNPKALRDALLKAMKESAPERYEEAIERYYEELVR